MYLDYSKIVLSTDGVPVCPSLWLQSLSGHNLGVLHGVHDLKFKIGYSELSEISFTIPYMTDGLVNPLYASVTGFKVIYTTNYGVYLLAAPSISGKGLEEVKSVTGYSIEKTFERKNFFLSEGTYELSEVLDRVIELDSSWESGYIAPSLIGRYRTFDEYDGNALSFLYGTMMEKYRCLVVCEPYKNPETGKRRINLYDADAEVRTLPIYLSYDNLLEEVKVSELTEELTTQLRVYGADDLSIRDVNPIGEDYIVNLEWFIENGDIPSELATRIHAWQQSIDANKEYYSGLVALRASSTAQKITMQAQLVDLRGELDVLMAEQSMIVQEIALETDPERTAAAEQRLQSKTQEVSDKQTEIDALNNEICAMDETISARKADIQAVNDRISYRGFFTDDERLILDQYMIQDTVVEESFVSTSVDTTVSGSVSSLTGVVSIADSDISGIDLTEQFSKNMYAITGGKLVIEAIRLSAKVIRGTIELSDDGSAVCSFYLGSCIFGDATHSSGTMTLTGTITNFESDVQMTDENGLMLLKGTSCSFSTEGCTTFFTVNASDYQKFSVAQELYDFGQEILAERAYPTYEFTVDSANFLFQREFEAFKNSLELGRGVYLMLGSMGRVVAPLIGIELDFENIPAMALTFSNRFQRLDGRKTLKDLLERTYSSSRSFDASKYLYSQSVLKTSQVSKWMSDSLDAAVNNIIGASNQSVVINGAGIHVGGTRDHQIRIVDNMIAMTDDGWQTARLAIGLLPAPDGSGEYTGVNAEVIMGKLLIGNNLVLENENADGVVQFKFDGSGAWLNNATLVLQKEDAGKILLSPEYGIVAGKGNVFTVDGTTITPSFLNDDGSVKLDADTGMPVDSSFYLDLNTGNAYFGGTLNATDGTIGGFTIDKNFLHSGTGTSYVALNGSASGLNADFAMWAGAETPSAANFYVRRDGTINVKDKLLINGKKALTDDNLLAGSVLSLHGVEVTNAYGKTTFKVDDDGNVTMRGNLTLGAGSTINWDEIEEEGSSLLIHSVNGTYIDGSQIYSGTVMADAIKLYGDLTVYSGKDSGVVGGYLGYANAADGSPAMHIAQSGSIYLNGRNLKPLGEVVASANGTKLYYTFIDPKSDARYDGGEYEKRISNQVYISREYFGVDVNDYGLAFSAIDYGGSIGEIPTFYSNCKADLGTENYPWKTIYANSTYAETAEVTDSDINLKKDISYDMSAYEHVFSALRPTPYRFINGTSGRTHTGFVAQDVEQAIIDAGLSTDDMAAFIAMEQTDGSVKYGLRYEEFIALNTHMIQKLMTEVENLRNRMALIAQNG